MRQPASRLHPLLMIGVLLPLLLVGATVAHTHDGAGIGLYNQEHDLVWLGALGSVAPLPALVVAVALVVFAWVVPAAPFPFDSSTPRLEFSRPPPTPYPPSPRRLPFRPRRARTTFVP